MLAPHGFRRKVRRGFTLLELLLVVGILVMLAAFALPAFQGMQGQAQQDVVRTQIAAFEDALKFYRQAAGNYPSTEQGLRALYEKPEEDPAPKRWAGPYLEDDDGLEDPWGNRYQYAFPGEFNEAKPDIWSFGPDGEDGTEDDIGNWSGESEDGEGDTESEEDF